MDPASSTPLDTRQENQPDAELLQRFVTTQDEEAFARLVQRHGSSVLGICRRVLHNHHDAEDAFQATFVVLARKARHIRQRETLTKWLYKVAYRLAMKLRAATVRQRRTERQVLPLRPPPADEQLTRCELYRVLQEEFGRLPAKYRAPLLLCGLAGRTRQQAAQRLGWTLGTVKMRLERGRQLLRARLALRGVVF